jgi:hypothetical protein
LDFIIFDGTVAIINTNDDVVGVVIKNDKFYENVRAIHKFVWDFLPPVEQKK